MGPKRTSGCVDKGKDRVDREEQTKQQFDPLDLEVRYPGTAILLLQCQEKPILLAATAALAKFGGKATENLEVLFDLDVVDSVIPLITHDDLFTRRFAAKLLAEMAAIENVQNFLLKSKYYIPHFTKVLVNEKDTFMQEFSSLILAELSRNVFGAAQLLKQCTDMDFLFERLQSPDPDIKKNTVRIMYNLLQDPLGAQKIIETKNFQLNPIYELYRSPYPEIQKFALDVTADFVRRNQDERLQTLFRRSNGLQALLDFIANNEWKDLHGDALEILALASDNRAVVEMLDAIGGIKQMLQYMAETSDSMLFMQALNVAVHLSHTYRGRQALHAYGIVDYLLQTLTGSVTEMYEICCHGIGMMTMYSQAAIELTESNCVRNVLDVVKSESFKWPARQAALFALNQLLNCDFRNCQEFLNAHGQSYLLRLLKHATGTIPVEILVGSVECFLTMARNQALKNKKAVINNEVIDALCASFQLSCMSMNDFKIACCKALSVICMEKDGRQEFLKVGGPRKLYNLLCDVKTIPIRNAAAQLIQLLCMDPDVTDAFIAARYLHYMLNNRSTAKVVPSWNTCIDALFDAHLPIKFAFTGRLSLQDITKDGFYVLRRNVCQFPILADIFRFKFCPLEPIYVVNCSRLEQSATNDSSHELSVADSRNLALNATDTKDTFLSNVILNLTEDKTYGCLQNDPSLCDYIEQFKCKLIAAESKKGVSKTTQGLVNVNCVSSRAKMLAKFVVRQMSGPDPMITCVDHQLEVHLKEIKNSIGTSVIPLGMLRVGSYFERALLFKIIADRIHLPAALVRGEYGKAWIEIAVPQVRNVMEDDSFNAYVQKDSSCPEFITVREPVGPVQDADSINEHSMSQNSSQTLFPTKLMKPNFIVDLMHSPGSLLPIGSRQARMYCEKILICDTVCEETSLYTCSK